MYKQLYSVIFWLRFVNVDGKCANLNLAGRTSSSRLTWLKVLKIVWFLNRLSLQKEKRFFQKDEVLLI